MSRHRFDPFSFIAGATAVGIAVAVLSGELTISLLDLRVAGPVLLLLLGLGLLLGGGRDRSLPAAPSSGEPSSAEPSAADGEHDAADGESPDAGDDAR
ncbi:hypothetical protein [Nitriliruptor alkaliphilus]|uniref:hypothetical protein n=1 Tax=Nitriliruptor alkaliphilus TaxID=427918 RepID=UPI0006969306|nr:hypothetical protein [Nitriliruptor alkaliphilus]